MSFQRSDTETFEAIVARLLREGDIISATDAAGLLGRPLKGRKRHTSTVVRWIVKGKQGVKLEGYHGPDGGWWTSRNAVARFLAALTAKAVCEALPALPVSPSQEDRERRASLAREERKRLRGVIGKVGARSG